ncbi:uncharacterized protein, partial [Littorina saxatilis]|uniref:uncharacterized protein n=1 Tax=Littorina saxatilis TaxID=31220 RepID=UPI0038B59C7A
LDIIVCDQTASTKCNIINPRYRSNGIVNKTLTLWIPNISQDFEDTYILHTPPTFPDACHLTVEKRDILKGSENNDGGTSRALIGVMVCVIVLAIAAVVSSFCLVLKMRKKYMRTSLHSPGKRDGTGADEPLLSILPDKKPNNQPENQSVHDTEESSPEKEQWYYGMIQREEEKSLFEYRRNGHGSFLIRQRITNPAHFTLAVKFEGDIQRFVIVPEENGFRCIETDGHFNTLPQLVKFYSETNIQVGETVWGKLSKPVERELKAEWYFGDVTDTEEARLLESGKGQETGLFLVKDGPHGLHDFILSVNVDGIVKRFPIIQQNNKFKLIDNGDTFQTLFELVESYLEQGTATDDNLFKLRQPAKKGPTEKWFFEHFSRDDEKLLLKYRRNGPGSFLIRQRITNPAHFTLSVLFKGDIHRFTIVPEQNGYKCIETEKCFSTLPHLVDFYKKHDIEVDDKVWGKLSKPFEQELEAEWYFGHIRDKDEAKLLKFGKKEKTGTFLVKDGTRGLHDYILSVNDNGIVRRFPIVQRNNAFHVPDTGGSFQTVLELVEHYRKDDIQTGEGVFKIKAPAHKVPEEEWYHEIFTADEQIKLLQSKRKRQGYFLIAPGNTNPNEYILTGGSTDTN